MGSLDVHSSPAAGGTPGYNISKHSRAKRCQVCPTAVLGQVRCLLIPISSVTKA